MFFLKAYGLFRPILSRFHGAKYRQSISDFTVRNNTNIIDIMQITKPNSFKQSKESKRNYSTVASANDALLMPKF